MPYFHITVTVPAELRAVLRAHQRDGYAVLMQATAGAIIELASDPRFVGGAVAVLAVLHTWDQQLNLHPHVHCLVSGGGISEDGTTWHPARRTFLLPIKALARKVRGKFRALLQQRCPDGPPGQPASCFFAASTTAGVDDLAGNCDTNAPCSTPRGERCVDLSGRPSSRHRQNSTERKASQRRRALACVAGAEPRAATPVP